MLRPRHPRWRDLCQPPKRRRPISMSFVLGCLERAYFASNSLRRSNRVRFLTRVTHAGHGNVPFLQYRQAFCSLKRVRWKKLRGLSKGRRLSMENIVGAKSRKAMSFFCRTLLGSYDAGPRKSAPLLPESPHLSPACASAYKSYDTKPGPHTGRETKPWHC